MTSCWVGLGLTEVRSGWAGNLKQSWWYHLLYWFSTTTIDDIEFGLNLVHEIVSWRNAPMCLCSVETCCHTGTVAVPTVWYPLCRPSVHANIKWSTNFIRNERVQVRFTTVVAKRLLANFCPQYAKFVPSHSRWNMTSRVNKDKFDNIRKLLWLLTFSLKQNHQIRCDVELRFSLPLSGTVPVVLYRYFNSKSITLHLSPAAGFKLHTATLNFPVLN